MRLHCLQHAIVHTKSSNKTTFRGLRVDGGGFGADGSSTSARGKFHLHSVAFERVSLPSRRERVHRGQTVRALFRRMRLRPMRRIDEVERSGPRDRGRAQARHSLRLRHKGKRSHGGQADDIGGIREAAGTGDPSGYDARGGCRPMTHNGGGQGRRLRGVTRMP